MEYQVYVLIHLFGNQWSGNSQVFAKNLRKLNGRNGILIGPLLESHMRRTIRELALCLKSDGTFDKERLEQALKDIPWSFRFSFEEQWRVLSLYLGSE